VIPLLLGVEFSGGGVLIHYGDTAIREGDQLTVSLPVPRRAYPVLIDVTFRKEGEPRPPCTLDNVLVWLEERGMPHVTREDGLTLMRIYNGVA
jgi:hypothetical protein